MITTRNRNAGRGLHRALQVECTEYADDAGGGGRDDDEEEEDEDDDTGQGTGGRETQHQVLPSLTAPARCSFSASAKWGTIFAPWQESGKM